MADKKKKKQTPKKSVSKKPAANKTPKATAPKKTASKKPAAKATIVGYSAKIKLPNGKTLVASPSGLRDTKTYPNVIVINSREQAKNVATNLANAYGKGAKPSVESIKSK